MQTLHFFLTILLLFYLKYCLVCISGDKKLNEKLYGIKLNMNNKIYSLEAREVYFILN